jgi:lipocalin-like protein
MRIVKWCVLVVVMLLAVPPCFADGRAPILGIWRLVSYEVESQATGEREDVLGKHPTGNIIFTPEGRMMVVLTGEGRKVPHTELDRADVFKSLVAYTGMYRVEGDRWITTVDVSANPAWVGAEQARIFRVDGDRLQESTAVMEWAARPDKGMVRFILTWERVNPDEFDKIKAMLLRPAGWKAYWSAPGDKGETDFICEARGEKVVAKLQNLTYPTTCEREVTISADVVKLDGCYDRDITLLFDPNDHAYPFKGTSFHGYEYKVKAK